MTQTIERTVLFADLRGSTALYESLGNAEATALVTQSVTLLGRVVATHSGTVVKTLGDGLMAMFPSPSQGVAAAEEMHRELAQIGGSGAVGGAAASAPVPMKLQIGLAHGELVEMSGDVFGDAVNVAARLLDHAGDNETLATADVLDGLEGWERSRFRSLDRLQLRGRAEPVHVHVHLQEPARRVVDSDATAYGEVLRPNPEPEGIRLIWLELNRVYRGRSLPVVLGRSPQATYVVDDNRVSRSHARIDWHGGTFQLVDLSYNGTYVRFDNDPETIGLRRGSCTLHGTGMIGLGAPPVGMSPSVRFEVMHLSEARRQPPVPRGPKP